MSVLDVTTSSLDDLLNQSESIVLLDFWASWCEPCVAMNKHIARVAEDHPDIVFGRVDIEHEKPLAELYEVVSVPFTVIQHDDRILFAEAGVMSISVLNDLIEQAKSAVQA